MGNDSNVTIDGELDATFTSYFDPEKHGQMSQTDNGTTVWASDDDEQSGEMNTNWWPSEVEAEPEDLNENQLSVIRFCVFNDAESMSFKEISEKATPDMSRAYANNVLKTYWPEKRADISPKSDETRNRSAPSGKAIESSEELESLRKGLLNGDTTSEHAEKYNIARNTIGEYARGVHTNGIEENCNIPPLEWDTDKNEYVASKEENQQEVCQQSVDELADTMSVRELTEALAKATNSSVEEIEAEADSIDIQPPQEATKVNDGLEIALRAMKATAQHEETIDALEVVERYL